MVEREIERREALRWTRQDGLDRKVAQKGSVWVGVDSYRVLA
jgi:hypothetical protein